MASAGPPLGTQLGQLGVNIANFVKDFNLRTSIYRYRVFVHLRDFAMYGDNKQ
jgi:ribosomal protein L11